MTKPLIIFDCDGVLVDSEPLSFAVLNDLLIESGVIIEEDWAYENYLGKSTLAVFDMVAKSHSVILTVDDMERMKVKLFERFKADLEPVNGIKETLPLLDYVKCVASSSQPDRIRLSLTKTGLLDFFEPHIFSSTMVKNGKPAPDLFFLAAETMGYEPKDCVVIEDSPAGIMAGKNAGMTVFAFTGGAHAEKAKLRQTVEALNPALIIDDIRKLPAILAAM